jgi:hypothetical protein
MLNNDRLSNWFLTALCGWTICFLIIGIPIFHLWLHVSTTTIAVFVGIGCASQLVVVPWLYSARATPQNPEGLVTRRTAAVLTWISLMTVLFFCYVQRGWPHDPAANEARVIFSASLVVLLILLSVAVAHSLNVIRALSARSQFFRPKISTRGTQDSGADSASHGQK